MKKITIVLFIAISLLFFSCSTGTEENRSVNATNAIDGSDLTNASMPCIICNESTILSNATISPKFWTISPSIAGAKNEGTFGEYLKSIGYSPEALPTSMSSELLDAQNRYRTEVGESPMVWSDTLASGSQAWANYLASINQLVHSGGSDYGENLAAQCPYNYWSFTQLVDNTWGSEEQYFKCGTFPDVSTTGNWADVGHYTQMIWPSTQQCGCGYAVSSSNCGFLVCRYSPPGNFIGQYICPAPSWSSLGGYITSSPSIVVDNSGKTEAWARGGDNGLWVNIDGTWRGKGGILTSDPFAAKDYNGKIHVFARGGDNAVWDFIYDPGSSAGHWKGIGGYITAGPSGAMDPTNHNIMRVAARGGDNALWTCDLDINSEAYSWIGHGGLLASRPYILFDPSGKEHILVRGGDNSLWDRRGVLSGSSYIRAWNYLGGYLTTGPVGTIAPGNTNKVAAFAKGGDNALWMCDVNSANSPETYAWYGLGGAITSDPFAIADSTANEIHTFVRGGDSALWENVFTTNPWSPGGGQWQGIGGSMLTYTPGAAIGSNTQAFVIGADHALWRNTHNTL